MEDEYKRGSEIQEAITTIPPIVKQVILDPVGFFKDMPIRGGFVEPLIFLVAMGVSVGVIQAILSAIAAGLGGPASIGIFFSLTLVPMLFTFMGFVSTFILYCIWNVMGSRDSFETAFRCGAYSTAIMPIIIPITTVLALIPWGLLGVLGRVLGLAWSMGLLIIASIEVHNLEPKISAIVFGAIWALFSLAVFLF